MINYNCTPLFNVNKIFIYSVYVTILLLISGQAQGQQSSGNLYRGGLSFNSGIGYIAVKDEYISKEKYSGTAPLFIIAWSKYYDDYKSNLSFEILNSAKIKNNNISAQVTELSLNLAYLYSIGSLTVFNKQAKFFLGPMPELFLHFRSENIAKGGAEQFTAYSFSMLFSLGSNLNVAIPLNDQFLLEGNLQSSIISMGGKLRDLDDNNSSMIKFTTLFKDLRASFESFIRYNLSSDLSFAAGYKFNVLKTSSWDYLISANDNLIFSISYSF